MANVALSDISRAVALSDENSAPVMAVNGSVDRLAKALSDRYEIQEEIGAGGMATVYLAHDLKHNRKVAVKVLRPELAAILGAERFLKEIEVTANLQHPNILALYDSGGGNRSRSSTSEPTCGRGE